MNEMKRIRNNLRERYMWGSTSNRACRVSKFYHSASYDVYRFLLHLRYYEYLVKQKTTPYTYIARRHHLRMYNKFAKICGFNIGDGVLGENVVFYHTGNIVINPKARLGEGCIFHGSCCIGVAHTGDEKAPVLGKNVDIGYGAVILGDIYIADDIKIGANSVVTKSFYTPGITIAGIPAKEIKKKEEN